MSGTSNPKEERQCREIAFVFANGTLNQMAAAFPPDHKIQWLILSRDVELKNGEMYKAGLPFLALALGDSIGNRERECMVAYLMIQSHLLREDPDGESEFTRIFLSIRRRLIDHTMCSQSAQPFLVALMRTLKPSSKAMLDEAASYGATL